MEEEHNYSIGVAPVFGFQKTKNRDDLDFAYGIEISLQCSGNKCKRKYFGQQLSIVRTERDGFCTLAFELALHYKIPFYSNLELDFGPHFGYQRNKFSFEN